MARSDLLLPLWLGLLACEAKSVDRRAQSLADAICPKAYSCCESGELAENDWAGTDVETCRSKTAEGFDLEFSRARASQKKGRSQFLPAQVDACIASISAGSCDRLNVTNHFSGVTGCDGFVEPLVPAGGMCDDDAECISGRCDIPDDKFVGSCETLATLGQACGVSDDCARDLLCHETTKTCFVPKPAGEVCVLSSECASFDCGSSDSGEKRCVAPLPDQCFYASACSFGRAPPGWMALAIVGLGLAFARRRRRS
jgi:MYXO-CTERM domain-containing protein